VHTNNDNIVTVPGFYSWGYYDNNLVLNPFYTNPTPQHAAHDTGLYYTYRAGSATLAMGYYSNGVFQLGSKSVVYTNYRPYIAQDNGKFYTYVNGVPVLAHGFYSAGYFENGVRKSGYYQVTPRQAIDNSVWYVYFNGKGIPADGLYTNGVFVEGKRCIRYTRYTPIPALDDSTRLYTATNGVVYPAEGAYSMGVLQDGRLKTDYINLTPQQCIDNLLYAIFFNGIATYANTLFTTGLFRQGLRVTINTSSLQYQENTIPANSVGINYTTPRFVIDDPGVYYVLHNVNNISNNWVVLSANGPFSTGYFNYGVKNENTHIVTPVLALDTRKYVTYTILDGVALANGPYENGFFYLGTFQQTYNWLVPVNTIDTGVFFIYVNGVPQRADGVFSTGKFEEGVRNDTYTNTTQPQQAIDDNLWYFFQNGVAIKANGLFIYGLFNNGIKVLVVRDDSVTLVGNVGSASYDTGWLERSV